MNTFHWSIQYTEKYLVHAAGILRFMKRFTIKYIYFLGSLNTYIDLERNICELTYGKCTVEEILDMNSQDDCCLKWNLVCFASILRISFQSVDFSRTTIPSAAKLVVFQCTKSRTEYMNSQYFCFPLRIHCVIEFSRVYMQTLQTSPPFFYLLLNVIGY